MRDGSLQLWERRGDWEQVTWAQPFAPDVTHVHLRVAYLEASHLQFAFSFDRRRTWHNAGTPVDASRPACLGTAVCASA